MNELNSNEARPHINNTLQNNRTKKNESANQVSEQSNLTSKSLKDSSRFQTTSDCRIKTIDFLEYALNIHYSGFTVVPENQDKKPIEGNGLGMNDWNNKFRIKAQTESDIKGLFKGQNYGIGFILKDNLYCIDFDTKNHPNGLELFETYKELIIDSLGIGFWEKLTIEKTRSNGRHLYFYCEADLSKIEKNLAKRENPENPKKNIVFFEFLTKKVSCFPTPEYEIIQNNFNLIPTISNDEANTLIDLAKSFNKVPEKVYKPKYPKSISQFSGEKSYEIFDNQCISNPDLILRFFEQYNWKVKPYRGYYYLYRPDHKGKTKAPCATFGFIPNRFYAFSGSTEFEVETAYSPSACYAFLVHNKNFSASAKDLAEKGYGKVYEKSSKLKTKPQQPASDTTRQKLASDPKGESLVNNEIADSIFDNEEDLFKSKKNVANHNKVKAFLGSTFDFRRNIINDRIEYKDKTGIIENWKVLNLDDVYVSIKAKGLKYSFNDTKSLLKSRFVPEFNPFEDYFKNLPAWDGKDNISHLASFVDTTDNDFFEVQLKKCLVRCIACSLDLIVNRVVFTLYSRNENLGKTNFIKFLCPFPNSKYYTQSPILEKKPTDLQLSFAKNFIYNLDEIGQLNEKEIAKLKAHISQASIQERRAYGEFDEDKDRRVNFFASTDKNNILSEQNDNTRWLIFEVKSINHNYKNYRTGECEVDINQVWAEAYHLYQSGFEYELSKEDAQKQSETNQSFVHQSIESELLFQYFSKCEETDENCVHLQTSEVLKILTEKVNNPNIKISQKKLGEVLSRKFERAKRYKTAKKEGVYGYFMKIEEN